MATERTVGTGKTFSTLASWEATVQGTINLGDETAMCYGLLEDNSIVAINGWNNSTNTGRIQPASGEETDGTSDSQGANLDVQLTIGEASNQITIEVHNIEFHTASDGINITPDNAATVVTITNCFFRELTDYGINCNISTAAIDIRIGGCLFKDTAHGIYANDADPTIDVWNCTADTTNTAYRKGAGDFNTLVNCYGMSANFDSFYGSPTQTGYNASDDTSPSGVGSLDSLTAADQFTNLAGEVYTLDTAGSLDGAGVPSGTLAMPAWMPATDMAGNTWQDPPSIGAYEIVSGGTFIPRREIGAGVGRGIWR